MDSRHKISILQFGARGDGSYDNTTAFEDAFSTRGVTVTVPAGIYMTGPITIQSDSTLVLESGAVLKFIPDPSLYRPVYTRWEGERCFAMHPCLYAQNAENVTVEGSGVIDGSGRKWWEILWDKKKRGAGVETDYEKALAALNPGYEKQASGGGGRGTQFLRPSLIQFNSCRNVTLRGVKIIESPFWTVHPVFTDNLTIDGITIVNPADSPNTDAIDIDSCTHVKIVNSYINVGDDGICIKSGSGEDGIAVNRPTYDVLVDNCTVASAHGGAVIGSETAAGIRDVVFQNCSFIGTDRGIRLKTRRGRGGVVENLTFRNISIDGCLCPFTFNMYYKCGAVDDDPCFSLSSLPVTDRTPHIRNILIENVTATGCRSSAGFLVGLPEARIENVTIRNSSFAVVHEGAVETSLSEMYRGLPDVEERGIRVRSADLKLENVVVEGVGKLLVEE